MARIKVNNILELIGLYDEDFISSISLCDIKTSKELKELLCKLEKANYVVTTYYQMLYNDYMIAINSDSDMFNNAPDIETVKRYKSIASRIQKAYNYVLYMITFENPFKF